MKKIVTVAVAVVVAGTMTVAPSTQAQSVDINSLLAQIAQLSALVAQLQAAQGGSTVSASYTFTRNLTVGSTGDDVKALQQFLNAKGYQIASTGAGSLGNESTYFGGLTKAALAKFQAANGISPAVGYFGPITIAKVNAMGGATTGGTTPVVVPGTAYLMASAEGPYATTIPDGSLYNKVLRVKLSAGSQEEKITSITVSRGGFIANTNVSGVSVWDDAGNRYGNIVTALTADGKATISFSSSPFTVPAGQTKYLTVAVNIAASTGSGTVSMSVASASDIKTSTGGAVSGAFPLSGATFTTVSGTNSLGNLYVDDLSVAGLAYSSITSATGNLEIGDVNKEVFKLQLAQSNSKEAVSVSKIILYVEGTIQEAKDVTNWKLYSPEGNVIATAEKPVDRFVTFNLTTPYVIDKGLTKTFQVKADITDGSGNYFRVYIQNDYDIVATGATTGASVQPLDASGTSLTGSDTQNDNGGFRMKSGGLTVSKSSTSPSGNVAPSSQNIVLAKFDLKSAGEKMDIQKMGIQVQYAGVDLTGTISVKDAATGETYLSVSADTGSYQATDVTDPGTDNQVNLSSYISLESGQTKTIEITGTIDSTATSTSNYKVSVGKFYVKRYSTNDYTDVAKAEYEANQISVSNVTLSVTKNTAFGNVYRAAGASNVKVAEFVLQASDADDIRVNGLSLSIASSSYIQNVKLMDGTTQLGSTVGTPGSSGNSYSFNLTIPKSASKVLSVYADVLSNASTTDTFTISVTGSTVSGYGVASAKSLSSTPSEDVEGQVVSVKSPTLTITADASKPLSKVIVAGQVGVEISKLKLEAANEDLTLKKVTLSIDTASTTQWTAATNVARNFSKVYLYDGTTLLNTGGTSVVSGDIVISGLDLKLAQDTPKILTVKMDATGQETIQPKAVGRIVVKSSSTTDMEVYSSQGWMTSGITMADTVPSNYMLFTAAAPVITNAYSGSTSKSGQAGDEIARFTISNVNGTRDITLASTTVTVALTPNGATSTVDTFKIYDAGDLSNAVASASASGSTSIESTSATSSNVLFESFSPAQTIPAGSSKTYVIKANTAAIKTITSTYTGDVKLSVKVNGSTGYSSTDDSSSPSGEELYWNDGKVIYSYTTTGAYTATYSNLNASDSGEVQGPTLTY